MFRRSLIFLLAGPPLGWLGLCLAAAISHGSPRQMGAVLPGLIVFSPFIFAVGALPASIAFWLDNALIERGYPYAWRSVACCALGALLSFGLFHIAPFPLHELRSEGLLDAIPGALAGAVCSYWSGRERRPQKSRNMGWSVANRE